MAEPTTAVHNAAPPQAAVPSRVLNRQTDLETVLEAWHRATIRLEQTHATLRSEVARLSNELEKKNRELARKNRLADLGQMASHVAHEVRNSLMPVTLYLSLLKRRLTDDHASLETLVKIDNSFSALDVTVNDLLHFTSQRDPNRQWFALQPLVDDVLTSLAPQLAAQGIHIVTRIPDQLQTFADRDMLRRALLNLALNALDAMPDGGQLAVTAQRGAGGLQLTVADTGSGLCDEALLRAFEPFFTTKSSGTGLGLAMVYHAAESHGGDVVAENNVHGGAALTLRIPDQNQEPAS